MPITGHNIAIYMLPVLGILVLPFVWPKKWNFSEKFYIFFLRVGLPLFVLYVFFFGIASKPNLVLFSNDGPLGYMNSAHYKTLYPGESGWNDLYWLGEPVQTTITISMIIRYLFNYPDITFSMIFLGWSVYGVFRYLERKRKNESRTS